MSFFDPIEQFDILRLFNICLTIFPVNLNLILLFNLLLLLLFIFVVNVFSYKTSSFYEEKINDVSESFYFSFNVFSFFFQKIFEIIFVMVEENILQKKKNFLMILLFIFSLILICNVTGLFPFTFTVTSSFIFTLFLSLSFFIGINLIGFFFNKSTFFRMFLPGGTPIFIAPFLILIEIISYLSRIFSLSIRLFANMMSGHALLKILIGFSWQAVSTFSFFTFLGFFPWVVVSCVIGLEIAIAFLQSYVFTILLCIYINDASNPH